MRRIVDSQVKVIVENIILTSLILQGKIKIRIHFGNVYPQVSTQQCTHGEIRLSRNSTPFEGGIDVCVNSSWETVCNYFWGPKEIQVACRQLGFQVSGNFPCIIVNNGIQPHCYVKSWKRL